MALCLTPGHEAGSSPLLAVSSGVSMLNNAQLYGEEGWCGGGHSVEGGNDGLSLGLPISTVSSPPGLGKVRRSSG